MNKDRIEGGSEVEGSIKEAIGKVMGDTKMEADGAAEKLAATRAPDAIAQLDDKNLAAAKK